ncbi:hypothetical protein JXA05_04115, partial [Candidatus Peregrinibacteria bacterium]|nr:hypothetical protein [Candidatus Peregrinibacteria bacterium]
FYPISRLEAMGILLADKTNITPSSDSRFSALTALAESRPAPNCLGGAEGAIREAGGGGGEGERLLAYALLADRLGFFGGRCELFTERGLLSPNARANYLKQHLLRKEAMRFLAFSTLYPPLQPDSVGGPFQDGGEEDGEAPPTGQGTVPGSGQGETAYGYGQAYPSAAASLPDGADNYGNGNPFGSTAGLTVCLQPPKVCAAPSFRDCKTVPAGTKVRTIGEVVYGAESVYTALWQKVAYGGSYYYAPLDGIDFECRKITEPVVLTTPSKNDSPPAEKIPYYSTGLNASILLSSSGAKNDNGKIADNKLFDFIKNGFINSIPPFGNIKNAKAFFTGKDPYSGRDLDNIDRIASGIGTLSFIPGFSYAVREVRSNPIGAQIVSGLASFIPFVGDAYDAISGIAGYDYIGKQPIKGLDRVLCFAGIIPIPGVTGATVRAGKKIIVEKAGKISQLVKKTVNSAITSAPKIKTAIKQTFTSVIKKGSDVITIAANKTKNVINNAVNWVSGTLNKIQNKDKTVKAAKDNIRKWQDVGINQGEAKRIQNAADKIGKPINVVGSRAEGKANPLSDWDYLIEGLTSRDRTKVKNSLPKGQGGGELTSSGWSGIDLLRGKLDKAKPYIPFWPKK